jgi:hypothetical protein
MSNNKQSSIEFLIKQKEKWGLLINDDLRIAKAMHKEETIHAYIQGSVDGDSHYFDSEQYYNETYGGNNG